MTFPAALAGSSDPSAQIWASESEAAAFFTDTEVASGLGPNGALTVVLAPRKVLPSPSRTSAR